MGFTVAQHILQVERNCYKSYAHGYLEKLILQAQQTEIKQAVKTLFHIILQNARQIGAPPLIKSTRVPP
jgi:ABC-type transport system involved in cytochrome c biogenesis permease component